MLIIIDFNSLIAASGWGQKASPLGEDFSILTKKCLMAVQAMLFMRYL